MHTLWGEENIDARECMVDAKLNMQLNVHKIEDATECAQDWNAAHHKYLRNIGWSLHYVWESLQGIQAKWALYKVFGQGWQRVCSRVTGGGKDEMCARPTRASSVSHCMRIGCMDGRGVFEDKMCIVHILRLDASALLCRYCWENAERVGGVGGHTRPRQIGWAATPFYLFRSISLFTICRSIYGVDLPVAGLVPLFQDLLESIRRVARLLLCMEPILTK